MAYTLVKLVYRGTFMPSLTMLGFNFAFGTGAMLGRAGLEWNILFTVIVGIVGLIEWA